MFSTPSSRSFGGETVLLCFPILIVLGCSLGIAGPPTSRAQPLPSSSDSVRTANADSVPGRRALLRKARAEKTQRLRAPERGSVERFFLWIENERILQRIGSASSQWKTFRVGPSGLGSGSGPGLRAVFEPFPLRPNFDLRFHTGASVLGYWRFGGSVGYRYRSVFGYLYSQVRKRPQKTYYLNLENAADPDDSQKFDIANWTSGGVFGVRPVPSLSIGASAAYIRYTSKAQAAETQPVDPDILNPAASTRYGSIGGHLLLDLRDVKYKRDFGNRHVPSSDNLTDRPLNPESGTLLSADLTRFQELSGPGTDFNQAEFELQQYVSFLNGYHTFALRHRSFFIGPENAVVPFYQLPYVGGDFTLRGYDEFRFRGPPHGLVYNLEYRYEVWHHLDVALFGDAGKVFDRIDQWGLTNLRYSYGAGLRFITDEAVLCRVGVAFDETRTPRLVLRFSNVF